jgi:pyroglutamyl-peptidase
MNVLLTGFGPFPGAPHNPTGPLVKALARRPQPGVRRTAHVFRTSYEAVDRELPELIARLMPDALVMFGLASLSLQLRIETRAHNVMSLAKLDADGYVPATDMIGPSDLTVLPLPAPTKRLLAAARSAGVPTKLSRDAGRYLCNYLCWRACEAALQPGGPGLAAFVHVPPVARTRRTRGDGTLLTHADLVSAGEAIVQAAVAAARTPR